jgi:hypothetical protein
MHRSSWLWIFFWLWIFMPSLVSAAQVVAPVEIKDPELRSLQTQYMDDLKAAGAEIDNTAFDYPFYLSRKLDLDEKAQKSADQRSMRFEHYEGKLVLAISGNYYASYSVDRLTKEQRVRLTFQHVALPILKAAVPKFQANQDVQGYALEISHHVTGKVMGVSMERPENVLIYLPKAAALKVLNAKTEEVEQAALLQGQFFVNAEPVSPWLNGELPHVNVADLDMPDAPDAPSASESSASVEVRASEAPGSANAVPSFPKRPEPKPDVPPAKPRDTSPEAIAKVDAGNKDAVAKLVKEMEPQAHFVAYVEPSFIVFRQELYLQVSLNTDLPESAVGSRYRIAANAFDDHISHLVRPALGYFFKDDPKQEPKKDDPKQDPKFDGISFSTTVHVAEKKGTPAVSEAVEFYFPFAAMRCYQKYDCTGQQLLDASTVLINGERVSLDLQIAEGSGH